MEKQMGMTDPTESEDLKGLVNEISEEGNRYNFKKNRRGGPSRGRGSNRQNFNSERLGEDNSLRRNENRSSNRGGFSQRGGVRNRGGAQYTGGRGRGRNNRNRQNNSFRSNMSSFDNDTSGYSRIRDYSSSRFNSRSSFPQNYDDLSFSEKWKLQTSHYEKRKKQELKRKYAPKKDIDDSEDEGFMHVSYSKDAELQVLKDHMSTIDVLRCQYSLQKTQFMPSNEDFTQFLDYKIQNYKTMLSVYNFCKGQLSSSNSRQNISLDNSFYQNLPDREYEYDEKYLLLLNLIQIKEIYRVHVEPLANFDQRKPRMW